MERRTRRRLRRAEDPGHALLPPLSHDRAWRLVPRRLRDERRERPPTLVLVATYDTGHGVGAEIVTVHAPSGRALVSNSKHDEVDVVDLRDPTAPRRVARPPLPAARATRRAPHVGVYPDPRSPSLGPKPECPVAFAVDGTTCVAVSLGWASAVALLSLGAPSAPRVLGAVPLGEIGTGREGVAVYRAKGKSHVLAANEISQDVSIFELR